MLKIKILSLVSKLSIFFLSYVVTNEGTYMAAARAEKPPLASCNLSKLTDLRSGLLTVYQPTTMSSHMGRKDQRPTWNETSNEDNCLWGDLQNWMPGTEFKGKKFIIWHQEMTQFFIDLKNLPSPMYQEFYFSSAIWHFCHFYKLITWGKDLQITFKNQIQIDVMVRTILTK